MTDIKVKNILIALPAFAPLYRIRLPFLMEAAIRNFFIAVFTPVARLLPGWNPSIFTWSSLVSGCAGGLAFYSADRHPFLYLIGGLLVAISGSCDSLDGIIARMNNRTNPKGDFLDHFFDRIIDIALLSGLAYSPGTNSTLGIFCLVFAMLNAYLATQIQASFGQRYYGGMGKAEMFVGIIVLSFLIWLHPGPLFHLAGQGVNFVTLFFLTLALLITVSFISRISHLRNLLKKLD